MDTSNLNPAAKAALARLQAPVVKDPVPPPPPPPPEVNTEHPDEVGEEDLAHLQRSEHGLNTQANMGATSGSGRGIGSSANAAAGSFTDMVRDARAEPTEEELEQMLAAKRKKRADAEAAWKKDQEKDNKTYYSRIPNSTFIVQKMKKGQNEGDDPIPVTGQSRVLSFKGNMLIVPIADAEAIAQLDAVADQPSVPIYTREADAKPTAEELQAYMEVRDNAYETVQKIAAAGGRA